MTSHIMFPQVDKKPVTFSKYWLQTILRKKLHFKGPIFSDDLSMAGAFIQMANPVKRAKLALEAGCNMILICNDHKAVEKVLTNLTYATEKTTIPLTMMSNKASISWEQLCKNKAWKQAKKMLQSAFKITA